MAFGRLKVDELETSTQTVNVDALVGIAADGDKGDITVSGAGTVWTIDDGAVDTAALGGDITAAGKALLDDADAAAQRTTLGLGGSATLNVGTTAGTVAAGDALGAHVAAADPHPNYALESNLASVATSGAYSDLSGTPTIPPAADAAPQPLGAAAIGVSTDYAREDHVHAMPSAADVGADASGTAASAISAHEAAADPHPGYALESSLATVATTGALGDLGDVDLTTTPPADGEALVYDSATGDWVPGAAGGTPGGTTGQLQWNSSGSFAGVGGSTVGATGDITLSLNGAASTPPLKLTGTWFSGGTATTTKPQFLIEPAGTTSTAWSTSGTGLGVNAASGFTGNLLDLQVDGTSYAFVNNGGIAHFGSGIDNAVRLGYNLSPPSGSHGMGVWATGSGRLWLKGYANLYLGDSGRVGIVSQYLGFAGTTQGTLDTFLTRDAANTLAQRNGTNAQTYRLYNTYTNASNYERAKLAWNSNVFEIGTEGAGTGSEQPVRITAATLKLPNLPTYADNTAATSGGLVAGDVYKTATGELRITV